MEIADVIRHILGDSKQFIVQKTHGSAFAPVNIALVKYWGKRNSKLNIPINGSLSIALPEKGAFTDITPTACNADDLILNGQRIESNNAFYQRLTKFLDNFRSPATPSFQVTIYVNIPISAGVASSACGYAALVLALNDLFNWQLVSSKLSLLARLGSGSAARSLWEGFVQWYPGKDPNGMDSYAEPLPYTWEDLRIGLLIISSTEKIVPSRSAMQCAKQTSPYFGAWIKRNRKTISTFIKAIEEKNFAKFGQLSETNALAMHATTMTAWPPICYTNEHTLAAIQKIWQARAEGLPLYFTQDAGPNLKLIFLKQDSAAVQKLFPNMDLLIPFKSETKQDQIIEVDEQDRAIGSVDKLIAHQQAICHRAFSVFIFRKNNAGKCELLLQQRHHKKYHSANLWTNTCCSHPRPGENILAAGERRLYEEMGMQIRLYPKGVFHYIAKFANGMTEHEVDHVLVGYVNDINMFNPNPMEVQNFQWTDVEILKEDLIKNPNKYTPWFTKALQIALSSTYKNLLDAP